MNISVAQVYVEEGARYPFSSYFQGWLAKELAKRTHPSAYFLGRYPEDYTLGFYISAKMGIKSPEIKGPGVYRRTKDVKYTIFLPFDSGVDYKRNAYRKPLKALLDGVIAVLTGLEIDASKIAKDADSLVDFVASDTKMMRDIDTQLLEKRKKAVAKGLKSQA